MPNIYDDSFVDFELELDLWDSSCGGTDMSMEEVIEHAQELFIEIATMLNLKGVSLRKLLESDIKTSDDEFSTQTVNPKALLAQVRNLGVSTGDQTQIEWFLRILVKPYLDNWIPFEELDLVLANYGTRQ